MSFQIFFSIKYDLVTVAGHDRVDYDNNKTVKTGFHSGPYYKRNLNSCSFLCVGNYPEWEPGLFSNYVHSN